MESERVEADNAGSDMLIDLVGVAKAEGAASAVDEISVEKVAAGRKAPVYAGRAN